MTKFIKNSVLMFLLLILSFSFVNAGMNIEERDNGDFVCSFSPDYEIHYLDYFKWTKNGDTVVQKDTRDYGSDEPIVSDSSTLSGVVLEDGDTLKCEVEYALTAPNYGTLIDSITIKKDGEDITQDPATGDVTITPQKPFPTTESLECEAAGLPEEASGYSWYKNNILISGEENSVLTSDSVGGFTLGETYKCKVENILGGVTDSYVYGSALVGITKDPDALRPEVSILEPSDGGSSRSGMMVSFSSMVEQGTEPFSFNWTSNMSGELSTQQNFNTDSLSVGKHRITLEVTDVYGEVGVDAIDFNIDEPTAPTVSIVSPSDNDHFVQSDIIEFSANIEDDDTIDSVVWTSDIDGEIEDGRNEASFSTTGFSTGTHEITVLVTDSDGFVSSDSITIEITHNEAPKVSIVFPNDGDVFKTGDNINFIGSSKDETTIQEWEWQSSRDGFLSSQKIFSTSTLSPGTHEITLSAKDEYGQYHETKYRIDILMNTQDFNAVSIVSPKYYDHFPQGQSIMFSAAVHNPDDTDTYMWGTDSGQGIIGTGNVINVDNLQRGHQKISFTAAKQDGSMSQDIIELYIDGPNDPTANIVRPTNNAAYKETNTITLTASGDSSWDYSWTSDVDGNLGNGKSIFADGLSTGKHIISLKVDNGNGVSIDKRMIYVLSSDAPSASIVSPTQGEEITHGSDVNLRVSAPDVTSGQWVSDIQGSLGTGKSLTTDELMVGYHKITFVGFDSEGNYVLDSINLLIRQASGPSVDIESPKDGQSFMQDELVEFNATAQDPDGMISQWQWTSNVDGVIGTQRSFTKDNLTTGKHDITVTVVDNNGAVKNIGTKTIWIFVGYDSFQAEIVSPNDGENFAPGERIAFESQAELQDGRNVDTYEWVSSEDGVIGTNGSFETTLSQGNHRITLTAVDSAGIVSVDEVSIMVGSDVPEDSEKPVASINGPFEIYEGQSVDFSSEGSYDPDGNIQRYEWHFGLGTPSFDRNPTVKFDEEGNYSVTLFVTDDTGNIASASTYVNVKKRISEDAEEYKSARAGIFVSEIFLSSDGIYTPGEMANIRLTFRNNLPTKVKDMTVTAMLPELGIFRQVGPFSIDGKERRNEVLTFDLPQGTRTGEYYLRLSVYDDDHTRVFYRPIRVE